MHLNLVSLMKTGFPNKILLFMFNINKILCDKSHINSIYSDNSVQNYFFNIQSYLATGFKHYLQIKMYKIEFKLYTYFAANNYG